MLPPTACKASAVVGLVRLRARRPAATSGRCDAGRDLSSDHTLDQLLHAPAPAATSSRPAGPGSPAWPGHSGSPWRSASASSTERGGRHRRRGAAPRLRAAATAVPRGLARLPRGPGTPTPRSAAARGRRVERLGHGAGGQRGQDLPRRLRRGTRPALGLVERAAVPGRLPRGLVARPLPDRDRAARHRRRRGREPRAELPVDRAATSRTGPSRRTVASTASRCSAACRWTRSRSRSCWRTSSAHRQRRLGARQAVRRLHRRARARAPTQERWENIGGYSPATIAAEIAGLVCAADIARSNGDGARARTVPGDGRPSGSATSSTARRPRTGRCTRRRRTTCGSPRTATPNTGAQIQISDGGPLIDQRRGGRPELPRPGAPRREVRRRPG